MDVNSEALKCCEGRMESSSHTARNFVSRNALFVVELFLTCDWNKEASNYVPFRLVVASSKQRDSGVLGKEMTE